MQARWPGTILLWLLATSNAGAQFAQLAATDDGKQLFFTSQMLLKGTAATSDSPEARLYRFSADRVSLFAQRGTLATPFSFSSGDGAANVSSSADGTLVAFTFNDICPPAGDCGNEAELRGAQSMDLGPGVAQVSRNGRWVFVSNPFNFDPSTGATAASWAGSLIDLSSGQRTAVSSPDVPLGLAFQNVARLASTGAVLVATANGGGALSLGLWKQGQVTPISIPASLVNFTPLALSDDASTIAGYAANGNQIVVLDVASGKVTVVAQAKDPSQLLTYLGASSNAQQILYSVGSMRTSNGPAYVWNSAGGKTTPLTLPATELVTAGTITGGGDFAFVATDQFRIVKFALSSGALSELFPAPAHCGDPGSVGGGSRVQLNCSFTGTVDQLSHEMVYDGRPLPVLESASGEIAVQIPWAWNDFTGPTLAYNVTDNSPFAGSQPLQVFDGAPAIVPADPGESSLFGIKIIKGDWSGLVTAPPAPGDIVNIYMTGLGPTVSQETTGVAASLTQPNPIQWTLSCRFAPQSQAAQLLFAGLAPGTIGVYQTTFRIPSDSNTGPITDIACTLSSPSMSVSFGPGTPAPGIMGNGFVFGLARTGRK